MSKTYFPIRTATSCQLKWNWTALYLNGGFSRTCHRTAETPLTPENFNNFHNTEVVLDDRTRMLQGLWPETSCLYCRNTCSGEEQAARGGCCNSLPDARHIKICQSRRRPTQGVGTAGSYRGSFQIAAHGVLFMHK